MAIRVREFQSTPNPEAMKCLLEGGPVPGPATRGGGPRSYASPEAAKHDPVAAALFAIAGVRNVLVHAPAEGATSGGWISVGKRPEVTWKTLKPAIEKALAGVQVGPAAS